MAASVSSVAVAADDLGAFQHQFGIEAGGQADRLRKDGGMSGPRNTVQPLIPPILGRDAEMRDGRCGVADLLRLLAQRHAGDQGPTACVQHIRQGARSLADLMLSAVTPLRQDRGNQSTLPLTLICRSLGEYLQCMFFFNMAQADTGDEVGEWHDTQEYEDPVDKFREAQIQQA